MANWLVRRDGFVMHPTKEPGHFRTGQSVFVAKAAHPRQMTELRRISDSQYIEQFGNSDPADWHVDASTDYMSDPGAIERILNFADRYCSEIRFFAILRDPIERAHSEYLHTIREGIEHRCFRETLDREPQRAAEGFQPLFLHARRSRYFDDVSRFRKHFGQSFAVMGFREALDSERLAERLSSLLGQELPLDPPMRKLNRSVQGLPWHFRKSHRLLSGLRRVGLGALSERLGRAAAERFWRMHRLTDADALHLFSHLKSDIKRCLEAPFIPTDDWETCSAIAAKAGRGAILPTDQRLEI